MPGLRRLIYRRALHASGDERSRQGTRGPPGPGARQRLYARRGNRPGRDGRRLQRSRRATEAPRRRQGAPTRARIPRRSPVALSARGGDRGAPVTSPHRADPLSGRGRRRTGVFRDGVCGRGVARGEAQATRPAAAGRGASHHAGDGGRARRRPRAGHHTPRREAGQHPAGGQSRARRGHRLWNREGAVIVFGVRDAHGDGGRDRDAALHEPGAGRGRPRDRRALGHLQLGSGGVSDAGGGAAVPGPHRARDPDEADHRAGAPRQRQAAGRSGGPHRVRDAVAREGSGGPLAHGGRAAARARGAQRHDVPAASPQSGAGGAAASPGRARARARKARDRGAGRPAARADAGAPAARAERRACDRTRAAEPVRHVGVGVWLALHDQRRDRAAPAELVAVRRGCLGGHGPGPPRRPAVARRILLA